MLQPKGKPRGRGLGRIPVGGRLVAHDYSRVVTEAWPRATAQRSQCTSDPSEGTGPPEERPPTKAAPPHEKAMERVREGMRAKTPKSPSVKWLWKEKATEAVLDLLRDTRVECVATRRKTPGGGSGA